MCHAFVISQTEVENLEGTDFKMGDGTRCLEYSELTLSLIDLLPHTEVILNHEMTFAHKMSFQIPRRLVFFWYLIKSQGKI